MAYRRFLTNTMPANLKSTRFKLADRFGWVCWYCNIKLTPNTANVDHVVAYGMGGSDDMSNLALSCEFCNMAKGYKPLDYFLEWLMFVRNGDSVTHVKLEDFNDEIIRAAKLNKSIRVNDYLDVL